MAKKKVSRIGAPLSKEHVNEGPVIKPQKGTRAGPTNVVGPAHVDHRFRLGGLPPALAQARDEETAAALLRRQLSIGDAEADVGVGARRSRRLNEVHHSALLRRDWEAIDRMTLAGRERPKGSRDGQIVIEVRDIQERMRAVEDDEWGRGAATRRVYAVLLRDRLSGFLPYIALLDADSIVRCLTAQANRAAATAIGELLWEARTFALNAHAQREEERRRTRPESPASPPPLAALEAHAEKRRLEKLAERGRAKAGAKRARRESPVDGPAEFYKRPGESRRLFVARMRKHFTDAEPERVEEKRAKRRTRAGA